MKQVGIDIGTCFSSTAVVNTNGNAEAIKICSSGNGDVTAMPTAVFFDKSEKLYIGEDAENRAMMDPTRYREHFKKNFGNSTPLRIGSGNYTADELYTEIFVFLKNKLTEMYGEEDWQLCVTHPASYQEDKRNLLKQAANRAGFMKLALLDEPTAAANIYAKNSKVQIGETLLVYDFGGGTFDLSLIKKTEGGYRQLAEPIGKDIGGTDIDEILMKDMLTKLLSENPGYKDKIIDRRFQYSLKKVVIKTKHRLSSESDVSESLMLGFDYFNYDITREYFNGMIKPLVDETIYAVNSILTAAGVNSRDVNRIIMVGGTSRIPLVRETLISLFGKEKVNTDIDPATAIACGAAKAVEELIDGVNYDDPEDVRAAANKGKPKAQYRLGEMYENGEYVRENLTTAAEWYRKAAEQGYAQAQLRIGTCYKEGSGVTANYTEAVKWYIKAAEQGLAEAQLLLGGCYYFGYGVTKNSTEAVKWVVKAAEQDWLNAQIVLGYIYSADEVDDIEQDYTEAFKWYHKAAQQGDSGSQYRIGFYYYNGFGVSQDYEEAFRWLTKAAEQEHQDAQYQLGLCYEKGNGVTQDYAKAAKWYEKAADHDQAAAQFRLGVLYMRELVKTEDEDEGYDLIEKAADNGHIAAQFILGDHTYNEKEVSIDFETAVKLFADIDFDAEEISVVVHSPQENSRQDTSYYDHPDIDDISLDKIIKKALKNDRKGHSTEAKKFAQLALRYNCGSYDTKILREILEK